MNNEKIVTLIGINFEMFLFFTKKLLSIKAINVINKKAGIIFTLWFVKRFLCFLFEKLMLKNASRSSTRSRIRSNNHLLSNPILVEKYPRVETPKSKTRLINISWLTIWGLIDTERKATAYKHVETALTQKNLM